MSLIPHRLIYYAPEQETVDLRHGCLTTTHPGTLRLQWGGLSLVAECPRLAGHAPAQSTTRSPLAPPDALLLSHVDPDSLAGSAIVRHWRDVPTITVPAAVDTLGNEGCSAIHLLDHWERIVLRKGDASIAVTAIPALHRPDGADCPDVMGSMLELRARPDDDPFRIYLSGGSLSIDELEDIPGRFPRVDLAVVYLAERPGQGPARTTDEFHAEHIIDITKPRRIVFVPLARELSAHRCMERLRATLDQQALGHLVSSPGVGGRIRFALPRVKPATPPAEPASTTRTEAFSSPLAIRPTEPAMLPAATSRAGHHAGGFERSMRRVGSAAGS
jgi:hypothetical protein